MAFVLLGLVNCHPVRPDPRIVRIAISTDGQWLAAGSSGGVVTIVKVALATSVKHIPAGSGAINDLQFSPDGKWLAVANRNLVLWPVTGDGQNIVLREDSSNYGSASFSPDGRSIVTVTGAGRMQVVDVRSRDMLIDVCCSSIYGDVAFTPDGLQFVNAGHVPRLWNATNGRLIARLITAPRSEPAFGPIAFDAKGGRVFVGDQEGRIIVWSLAKQSVLGLPPRHREWVESIVFSPARGEVAYAARGGPVRIWNPDSGSQTMMKSARPSSNILFTPDGHLLLFGTETGQVEFWKPGSDASTHAIFVH